MPSIVEYVRTPVAQAIVWCALLGIVLTISWYFLSSLRVRAKTNDRSSDYLSYFREIHGQGGLTEHEFRSIKANLDRPNGDQSRGTSPNGLVE